MIRGKTEVDNLFHTELFTSVFLTVTELKNKRTHEVYLQCVIRSL